MIHPNLIAGGWHIGQDGAKSATIPSRYHPSVAQNKRRPWATGPPLKKVAVWTGVFSSACEPGWRVRLKSTLSHVALLQAIYS